jgi:hypothetical protein
MSHVIHFPLPIYGFDRSRPCDRIVRGPEHFTVDFSGDGATY